MKDQKEILALTEKLAALHAHQIDMGRRMDEVAELLSSKASVWDRGVETAQRLGTKEEKWDRASVIANAAAFVVSLVSGALATNFIGKYFSKH